MSPIGCMLVNVIWLETFGTRGDQAMSIDMAYPPHHGGIALAERVTCAFENTEG